MNNNMPIAAEPLSFTFAWRHLSGWWRSHDCWPGALSVLGLLLLIGLGNRVAVWQNDLSKLAMDATQVGDIATLMSNLGLTVLLMIVSAGFINLRQYAQGALLMPWRQWQTRHTLARWFAHRAFHRIERDGLVENADQRIADDLRLAIETTTALVFGLIGTLVMLVTFVPRLYAQSGPFSFAWGDGSVVIPGFMLWAAIAFALLLALLTHGAGHRLAATEALQESTEASLRFGLIRVRENAEQIAFYGGMDAERAALGNSFAAIVRVYWRLLFQRNLVGFVNLFVNNFDKILPALLFAPRIVGGQATLGDLTQVSMTFGMVVTQLTWFSRSYVELANWAGVFKRLSTLDRALRGSDAPGLERVASGGPHLATPGIELHRPDGSVMAHVPALAVGPGERVLLRGPSGVGKSTLLRALAGLWPFGAGRAEVPDAGMAMFLPQQPYLPLGTLAEVLSYPAAPQAFGAEQYRNALAAFGLSALADELEVETAWHLRLSPGEQQRVAAARVLLQRPQVLIIDEATSALDVASEQTVYRTLLERLPHLALLSVAHQPGAEAFHTRSVELTPPLPATPRTT